MPEFYEMKCIFEYMEKKTRKFIISVCVHKIHDVINLYFELLEVLVIYLFFSSLMASGALLSVTFYTSYLNIQQRDLLGK